MRNPVHVHFHVVLTVPWQEMTIGLANLLGMSRVYKLKIYLYIETRGLWELLFRKSQFRRLKKIYTAVLPLVNAYVYFVLSSVSCIKVSFLQKFSQTNTWTINGSVHVHLGLYIHLTFKLYTCLFLCYKNDLNSV